MDQTSRLNLSYSLAQDDWIEPGEGIVIGDPRFRNPLLRDYRLGPNSPALASGLGGADMDVLWPVGGLPENPADL